jgi:hypothetical protein
MGWGLSLMIPLLVGLSPPDMKACKSLSCLVTVLAQEWVGLGLEVSGVWLVSSVFSGLCIKDISIKDVI